MVTAETYNAKADEIKRMKASILPGYLKRQEHATLLCTLHPEKLIDNFCDELVQILLNQFNKWVNLQTERHSFLSKEQGPINVLLLMFLPSKLSRKNVSGCIQMLLRLEYVLSATSFLIRYVA